MDRSTARQLRKNSSTSFEEIPEEIRLHASLERFHSSAPVEENFYWAATVRVPAFELRPLGKEFDVISIIADNAFHRLGYELNERGYGDFFLYTSNPSSSVRLEGFVSDISALWLNTANKHATPKGAITSKYGT